MDKVDKLIFGERLRCLRKQHHLTMEQASEMLDVSVGYYGLVERGQRMLSVQKLVAVSKLFSVSLDYLLLEYSETTDSNCLPDSGASLAPTLTYLLAKLEPDEQNFIVGYIADLSKLFKARTTT